MSLVCVFVLTEVNLKLEKHALSWVQHICGSFQFLLFTALQLDSADCGITLHKE